MTKSDQKRPVFLRGTQQLDAFGKPVKDSETEAKTAKAPEPKAPEPKPKTGKLPVNTVGIGKLKALLGDEPTYEDARGMTDQQLLDAGLDAEQLGKLKLALAATE